MNAFHLKTIYYHYSYKHQRNKGDGRPPQEFDPLPTQRVPPKTILRYPFLVMDPKIFLKAPIYTNFEGAASAEITQIFGQNFPKKLPKNVPPPSRKI